MRKLQFTLDRNSLETIYFSFIKPLFEYADVVRDSCTQYEVDELEKIQIEAARIVTGATKLESIDSFYTETGWETLSSRRLNFKLLLFFKMKSARCPTYLSSLLLEIILFTLYVMQTIFRPSKQTHRYIIFVLYLQQFAFGKTCLIKYKTRIL